MPAATDLSPAMRARYGLDRNPWPLRAGAAVVIAVYAAILILFANQVTEAPIQARLVVWQQPAPDRVDVTFEVRRPADLALTCVVRAQDGDRVDVGYATTEVPAGTEYVQTTYQLRVLAPAAVVELLACGPADEPLRVQPAAFPPGVVPPTQPWEPPA